jgi:hypothetical protein
MPRPRLLAAGAVVLLLGALLGAVVVLAASPRYPMNGPLPPTPRNSIILPVSPGEIATFGMPLNIDLPTAIVLREVEPLGVTAAEIVATGACYSEPSPRPNGDWVSCAGTTRGWRAWYGEPVPVDGTTVAPGPPGVGVLVGVRRLEGTSRAGFRDLRIVYDAFGRRFEVVQPWAFVLIDPGTSPPDSPFPALP